MKKFLARPYYSQCAVFAYPLSAFFIKAVILGLQNLLSPNVFSRVKMVKSAWAAGTLPWAPLGSYSTVQTPWLDYGEGMGGYMKRR